MIIKYAKITSTNFSTNINASYDETSTCPLCHHFIKPETLYSYIYKISNSSSCYLSLLHECPRCRQTFLAKYEKGRFDSVNGFCQFNEYPLCSPSKIKIEQFDDFIAILSPQFIKIYNQALQAENENLDEIAGIGYRKALEFLIKDFLISQNPDKSDSIKNTALGNCINTYIDNPQLKSVSSRAVWLGNDQTHYIQNFENKDINDLKRLIKLTVNWITMLYLTEEAINDIEKP